MPLTKANHTLHFELRTRQHCGDHDGRVSVMIDDISPDMVIQDLIHYLDDENDSLVIRRGCVLDDWAK